jgi:hypothetical protein
MIVDEALQCFGGYGFTEEFPIARHYRDARVSRIYEGTNEINRVFLADRLRRRGVLTSAGDSFISELAGRAMATEPKNQIQLGALSDLVMLTHAEQSARLRAAQSGGRYDDLYRVFVNLANADAARAYATVTGESAGALPPPLVVDMEDLAGAVLDRQGPL